MRVHHYSEDGTIERFVPRAPRSHPDAPARVWAIDETHAPLYLFPADCPRVAWWPLGEPQRMTIAIDHSWWRRAREVVLFRYAFESEGWYDTRDHGVWVSERAMKPREVERLENPLDRLPRNVELRIMPDLAELARRRFDAAFHVSTIRMRNLPGWTGPPGTPTI